MSVCKRCGAQIVFKPHPMNPEKMAPYNPDGKIHFETCAFKGSRKDEYQYFHLQKGNLVPGFKLTGEGTDQALSVVLESQDNLVRCQTMLKDRKIFFEVMGETEIYLFLTTLLHFAKDKGIIDEYLIRANKRNTNRLPL